MGQVDATFEQAKSHFLDGLAHMEGGRWGPAEQSFRTSLRWVPDRPSTLTNLAGCLIRLDRFDEAEVLLMQTLTIDADQPQAWLNRGLLAAEKKNFAQALRHYDVALNLAPQDAEIWGNKGMALSEMARLEEALDCMDEALKIDPDRAEFWSNRAVVWAEKGAFDQALADHERASALAPQDAETQYNQALFLLRMKRFPEGFELYESRWGVAHFGGRPLVSDVPRWDGSEPAGPLLLWAEQGLGDEIFYASFLSAWDLPRPAVTVAVDARLVGIFKRSFPDFQVISRSEAARLLQTDHFRAQAPMGSLGALLRMNEQKIRAQRKPYLIADSKRRDALKRQLTANPQDRVCGVSWASKNTQIGEGKSIALVDWGELLQTPDVTFVNLQYGDVSAEIEAVRRARGTALRQVEGLDLYDDIEGALALVDACERIITTSNVTAHLAGALGKTACVLVPSGKGKIWYWHDTDEFSLWYPSLRLLHQPVGGDWGATLREAHHWLAQTSGTSTPH